MVDLSVMDFAGGIVIHINAIVAALVSAQVSGKRKGFPTIAMPPHNYDHCSWAVLAKTHPDN